MKTLDQMILETKDQKDPYFTNEEGVKWWVDDGTTRYALSRGLFGTTAWIVETPNGESSRLLTKVLGESTTLEGIGFKIDMLAALTSH